LQKLATDRFGTALPSSGQKQDLLVTCRRWQVLKRNLHVLGAGRPVEQNTVLRLEQKRKRTASARSLWKTPRPWQILR